MVIIKTKLNFEYCLKVMMSADNLNSLKYFGYTDDAVNAAIRNCLAYRLIYWFYVNNLVASKFYILL